jgi:hypothetical protein
MGVAIQVAIPQEILLRKNCGEHALADKVDTNSKRVGDKASDSMPTRYTHGR